MTAAIISVTEKGTMQSELLYKKLKQKVLNAKDSATANMHLSVLKAMKPYQYL